MNDSAIKNYATWARRELISQVQRRCARYGILEQGSPDAKADAIDGRVLTAQEKSQRAKLLSLVAADGWQELVERAAYTWFNRLLAIRFMEVNDRLPSHVRVLSAADGTFAPQALHEAMDLPLDALDREEAARLVQAGDDEALFRLVFLAQCDELADCMPAVFSHIGGAMELLLPDSLLRAGGVVEQLERIDEDVPRTARRVCVGSGLDTTGSRSRCGENGPLPGENAGCPGQVGRPSVIEVGLHCRAASSGSHLSTMLATRLLAGVGEC